MIQTDISCHANGQTVNEYLWRWQEYYTKRKIINIGVTPTEPAGWFLTIVYDSEVLL
jgi:hypothetical protein